MNLDDTTQDLYPSSTRATHRYAQAAVEATIEATTEDPATRTPTELHQAVLPTSTTLPTASADGELTNSITALTLEAGKGQVRSRASSNDSIRSDGSLFHLIEQDNNKKLARGGALFRPILKDVVHELLSSYQKKEAK